MAYQEGSTNAPRQATIVDMLESRVNTVSSRIRRCSETINNTLDQVVGSRPQPPSHPGGGISGPSAVRVTTLIDTIDQLESAASELEITLNRLTP